VTTTTSRIEERILGALMGVGVGVLLGFFLRDRDGKLHQRRDQGRTDPPVSPADALADL
jgi:hypothetical protein